MKIYDEFTSKVKSAAHTSDLRKFVEKLCAKMNVRSVSGNDGVLALVKDNDGSLLKILRDDTQYVIMLMREKIEEKKEFFGTKEKAESEVANV